MNLALHGFFLQVIISVFDFHHGFGLCSAGEPGYLDFDNLPETNFSCQGKVIGGYYADVETGCQMFHVCTIGQKDEIMDIKFLCLNGTVFDQETRVCERVDEVDCSTSERFYNLNLELYGNNAVTLSLHENSEDDGEPTEGTDDHQQRTTSARPSTTSSTTTTTSRPTKPSTTPRPNSYQHPTGYPQHYQPQPPFPSVQTSQSKSLYDDKNGGYHHQYIFHNAAHNQNNQATSYQLFSNQGSLNPTTNAPQIHQVRYSSSPTPQVIHNEPSTVAPLFHAPSSTIHTLLNSNANNPVLINPLFHNNGIASTTEQFSIHSNNPRETSEYRDNEEEEDEEEEEGEGDGEEEEDGEEHVREGEEEQHESDRRPLVAVQSINKGKVSKLAISPIPSESTRTQPKATQAPQLSKISNNFLPTPTTAQPTVRSFYPTPRPSAPTKPQQQSNSNHVTQHIHLPPPPPIPHLKPHLITINLPPPDIQRIVQNPSPLLPSQSRVIVTAKASVSDESGRPLNSTQFVTLPLPTIPASYDDYKEGDESFDPFYKDVPKIRNARRVHQHLGSYILDKTHSRDKRSVAKEQDNDENYEDYKDAGEGSRDPETNIFDDDDSVDDAFFDDTKEITDIGSIKKNLQKFKAILLGERIDDSRELPVTDFPINQSERTVIRSEAKPSKIPDSDATNQTDTMHVEQEHITNEGTLHKLKNEESSKKINVNFRNEKQADKSVSVSKESDAEEHVEIKTFLNSKESDGDEYVEPKSLVDSSDTVQYKSNLNSKESDEEEYVETKSVLNSKESDAEEGVEDKAVKKGESPDGAEYKLTPNTEESDAAEHTGAKSAKNSKESDTEEYVDPKSEKNIERTTENIKSTTVTGESDAEEGNEPKFSSKNKETATEKRNDSKSSSNSKESDAEKQIERKSTPKTKESDADEYIEREEVGPDKTLTAKEHIEMKSVLSSKESDAEEYIETKSILNSKESDAVVYVKSKSATEVGKIDPKVNDEGAPPSKGTESPEESKAKETLEVDSVSNPELLDATKIDKSKFHGNLNMSDSAKNVVAESALNTENVSTERYAEPKPVSTIKNSDAEDKEIKSADVSESSKLTATVENTNDGRDESRSSVRLDDSESRKNGELEPQEESNKEEDAQTEKPKTMSIAEEPPVEREEKSNSKYAETTAQKSRKNKAPDEHSSTTDQPRTGVPRLRPPKLRFPSSFTSNAAKRTESAKENQRKPERYGARPNGPRSTTRPPLSLESESEEQIDSQIFEEPESRTSKEVDTREVGALGGSKDSKNHLGKGVAGVQDKPAHRSESAKGPTKDSSVLDSENQSKEEISVEKEKSTERDISIEEDVLPSNEEEYASDENTSNVQSDYEGSQQYSDEYSEEKSVESPNKIDSLESDKGPRRDKSLKFEKENDSSSREKSSRRQDKSKKFAKSRKESEEEEEGQEEGEDYTSQETLPDKFSGEIESVDRSAEYPDSREESFTESQELDSEDDYKGSQSREYGGSEEPLNSQEGTSSAVEKSLEEDAPISSTEAEDTKGVLKFTDELPRTDKKDDNADKANTTSDEDIVQDYVDDNYEPALYKEQNKKKSTSMQDQLKKEDQEMGDENREKSKDRDISDKSEEDAKEHSDEIEDRSEGGKSEEIIGPTSSTTTTTTTTRKTVTTTVRPTSPKLFRPFMARKNYNYIPPSTTANPVVIKPTFGLYNPKPAKRIKSYNEIAPKPIIRKHPLLARKAAAVNSNTQKSDVVQKRIDEFENSSEIIFVSTEVTGSEENALEPVTSQIPESNEATRSNITSDKVSSDDASLQRSKDEINPSVSETNVPISSTEKSPSEFQIATSTPYPLSRGATMANGPTTSNPLDDTLSNNNESTTQVSKAGDSNSSTVTENLPENTSLFSKEAMTLSSIATLEPSVTSMPEHDATTAPSDERPEMHETYEKPKTNKPLVESTTTKTTIRNQSPFNCLEKEMYRFYGDPRDCRLFHYCSPGFTSRQVLDFRFVCEEGTVFDEASQNCRHDTEDSKCIKRIW